jgi:hypothetical protein
METAHASIELTAVTVAGLATVRALPLLTPNVCIVRGRTEFWGLDTHHLEQWQIPLAQRRFSLFKDAPRVLTETTLQRWYRKLIDTGGKGN